VWAFAARRFVGWSVNQSRFREVFAQSRKWFHPAGVLFRGPIRDETKPAFPARDQQKWEPVLRPIARQFMNQRMIFSPNRPHFGGSCA
jgi:hypothetical protein